MESSAGVGVLQLSAMLLIGLLVVHGVAMFLTMSGALNGGLFGDMLIKLINAGNSSRARKLCDAAGNAPMAQGLAAALWYAESNAPPRNDGDNYREGGAPSGGEAAEAIRAAFDRAAGPGLGRLWIPFGMAAVLLLVQLGVTVVSAAEMGAATTSQSNVPTIVLHAICLVAAIFTLRRVLVIRSQTRELLGRVGPVLIASWLAGTIESRGA